MKTHATIAFETAVRELRLALKLIQDRQAMARVDQQRAVEAKNYAGAGTYDGQIIGLMQAETILRDSIKENEQRMKFSQSVDDHMKTELDGLTRVDPRGAVGERRAEVKPDVQPQEHLRRRENY